MIIIIRKTVKPISIHLDDRITPWTKQLAINFIVVYISSEHEKGSLVCCGRLAVFYGLTQTEGSVPVYICLIMKRMHTGQAEMLVFS